MKKLASVLIAAILTTIYMTGAMAAEEGLYGVLSIGYSPLTNATSTTSGYGIEVGGGYSFNQYIGVEAVAGALGVSSASPYNIVSLSVSAVGHVPLSKEVGIYAKAGEGETLLMVSGTGGSTSQNYSGTGVLYGAGVEFAAVGKTYRIGVDHYDLSVNGITLSTNYVNLTAALHF